MNTVAVTLPALRRELRRRLSLTGEQQQLLIANSELACTAQDVSCTGAFLDATAALFLRDPSAREATFDTIKQLHEYTAAAWPWIKDVESGALSWLMLLLERNASIARDLARGLLRECERILATHGGCDAPVLLRLEVGALHVAAAFVATLLRSDGAECRHPSTALERLVEAESVMQAAHAHLTSQHFVTKTIMRTMGEKLTLGSDEQRLCKLFVLYESISLRADDLGEKPPFDAAGGGHFRSRSLTSSILLSPSAFAELAPSVTRVDRTAGLDTSLTTADATAATAAAAAARESSVAHLVWLRSPQVTCDAIAFTTRSALDSVTVLAAPERKGAGDGACRGAQEVVRFSGLDGDICVLSAISERNTILAGTSTGVLHGINVEPMLSGGGSAAIAFTVRDAARLSISAVCPLLGGDILAVGPIVRLTRPYDATAEPVEEEEEKEGGENHNPFCRLLPARGQNGIDGNGASAGVVVLQHMCAPVPASRPFLIGSQGNVVGMRDARSGELLHQVESPSCVTSVSCQGPEVFVGLDDGRLIIADSVTLAPTRVVDYVTRVPGDAVGAALRVGGTIAIFSKCRKSPEASLLQCYWCPMTIQSDGQPLPQVVLLDVRTWQAREDTFAGDVSAVTCGVGADDYMDGPLRRHTFVVGTRAGSIEIVDLRALGWL